MIKITKQNPINMNCKCINCILSLFVNISVVSKCSLLFYTFFTCSLHLIVTLFNVAFLQLVYFSIYFTIYLALFSVLLIKCLACVGKLTDYCHYNNC